MSCKLSRRDILKKAGVATVMASWASLVAACQPQATPTPRIIEKEVIKEVTKEVPKEKVVEKVVTATAPAPKGPTELKWAQWWPWEYEPGLVKAATIFEQENNTKLVKEIIPWAGFAQKMLTLAAADSLPDIFGVNGSHVAPYGYRGILLNLQPFVERDHFPLEDYFENTLKIYNYPQGKLIALPDFVIPANAAFYNKDLFDQAGIKYPTTSWTWNDVLPMAQALTNSKANQYGVQFVYSGGLPVTLFGAWGGAMADNLADPEKATFDSPELEELVNWTLDLIYKYKVCPSPDSETEMGGANEMMVTGKLAFSMGWQMDVARKLLTAQKLKWGETISPHKPGAKPRYPEVGAGYGAPAKSKNPELAWKFLSFCCGPTGWTVRLPVELQAPFVGWPPAIKSFALKRVEGAAKDLPDVPTMMAAVLDGSSYPWWMLHPGWEEFLATALTPIGQRIMRREMPVKQGLKDINTAAQKMIDNPPPK